MTATCPTCEDPVPFGNADHGDVLACPACGGNVTVRRPQVIIRPPRLTPPSRGLFVIRALGVGTGLLLMLIGCCGLAGYAVIDHITTPEFVSYTDQDGRYTVEFPTQKPSKVHPTAWTPEGPVSFPMVMCERSMPEEAYLVAWLDLPKERLAMGPDAILDDACSGAATYNPLVATEISRTSFACHGHPGREMICAVRGSQGKGILRVVLSGKRLYLLFVGGGFIQTDSDRARQFLDSFEPF